MKVFAVHCHICKTIIYSRTKEDIAHCICNNLAISNGFNCPTISWTKKGTFTKIPEYDIGSISVQKLYEDWKTNTNKYGIDNYKIGDEKWNHS